MPFPTTVGSEPPAAQVWQQMVKLAGLARQNASVHRQMALDGQLTPRFIFGWCEALRQTRTFFVASAATQGLQAYGRQATGNAAFDLAAELVGFRDALDAVITAGRTAIAGLPGVTMAADGSRIEIALAPANAAAWVAACDAILAATV